uniref:Uncharacterized protein n=1 Tax=Oryza brachyantha TaxID=4533 RepID=J3L652_ORYBR
KRSAVLICSNPSQTLIHTPMPPPKSTKPSVTASPDLIKAQTAEISISARVKKDRRWLWLQPPQKRRRLPPNTIVSRNT